MVPDPTSRTFKLGLYDTYGFLDRFLGLGPPSITFLSIDATPHDIPRKILNAGDRMTSLRELEITHNWRVVTFDEAYVGLSVTLHHFSPRYHYLIFISPGFRRRQLVVSCASQTSLSHDFQASEYQGELGSRRTSGCESLGRRMSLAKNPRFQPSRVDSEGLGRGMDKTACLELGSSFHFNR